MTNISKGKRSFGKLKGIGDHDLFLNRITKTLYYSRLPMTECLSLPVTEFAAELFTEINGGLTLERLDVEEAGKISRNACASPCSLVLALLYLERLKDCNPEYLHKVAPSKLFLVSLMVASKFLYDEGEDDEVFNMEWAKSGGLTIGQINHLEMEFLGAIDWTVFVHNHDFWERLLKLEKDIAYKEAQKRGWFSYTELACLMDNARLAALIHAFVSVSTICLATYAAGVVTLLGSVLVASQLPGTSLAPRSSASPSTQQKQQILSSNLTSTSPHSGSEDAQLLENAEAMLQEAQIDSEHRLSQQFRVYSPNCCNSSLRDPSGKLNSTREYVGWEWWLSSVMNWLAEYSQLAEKTREDSRGRGFQSLDNEKLERTGAFITKSQYLADERYMREAENLIMEINWKDTLTRANFHEAHRYWRYYASKISLGHSH